MADTSIEWATKVWNPTTGCDRVSPGCDNCYALAMAKRLKAMGARKYQRDGDPRTSGPGFAATHHSGVVGEPSRWKKPERIFVNSMSDLFHDDIPDQFIAAVWDTMRRNPHHTFMVLTKRHARMRSLLSSTEFQEMHFRYGGVGEEKLAERPYLAQYRRWPLPNVWLGVSVEDAKWAKIRGDALRETPASVRFFSCEPLLGPIYAADLTDINWVIVGGESGPGARPMHPRWAESLHRQCEAAGVAFTFKQWGAWTPLAPLKDGMFDFSNGIAMTDDGNTYQRGDLDWPDGPRRGEATRADFPHHHPTSMYRVGKKRAGRELYHDGRTFDTYPKAVTV